MRNTNASAGLAWLIGGLAIAALDPAAPGQTVIHEILGPPNLHLGAAVCGAGDLDFDGVPDVLALALDGPPGPANVYSGADGSLVHSFLPPRTGTGFGPTCAAGVDVTGDGVPDVLLSGGVRGGAQAGIAWIFSGADKTLYREQFGAPNSNFGWSVAFLEDLDGDGVQDYGVGAPQLEGNGQPGEVHLFSGASGDLLQVLVSPHLDDDFGARGFTSLGDVDGDGTIDVAIGSPHSDTQGLTDNGAIHVFSGATGQILYSIEGTNDFANLGVSILAVPDADHDGIRDIVSGHWAFVEVLPGIWGDGRVVLYSGVDGSELADVHTPPGAFSGTAFDTVEDIDGDGRREILVGETGFLSEPAHVEILSIHEDPLAGLEILPLMRVDATMSETNTAFYARHVATVGDVDGDGREDWAVADKFNHKPMSLGGGVVWVYSHRPLYAMAKQISAFTGGRVDFDLNAGVQLAGGQHFLLLGISGTSPGFYADFAHVPINFDAATLFSIGAANGIPFVNTFGTLDPVTGKGNSAFDTGGSPLPSAAIGLRLRFAYAARASPFAPWTFASNPQTVAIKP